MLARRKRREDEEELLVPHGMIWQATENGMSPQPETTNQATPQEPAKAPAVPAPSSSACPDADPTTTKPKRGAISPPLPWPSPKIQEIARPVRPRFTAVPPEVKSPPPISAPESAPVPNLPPVAVQTDSTEEMASRVSLRARLHMRRDALSQLFARSRQGASRALLSTRAGAGKLQARVRNAYPLSKLGGQVHDVEKITAEPRDAAHLDPAPLVDTQESRAGRVGTFSPFASIRGAVEHALSYTRLKCGRALLTTRDSLNHAAHAANNAAHAALAFRIKIKFQRPKSTMLESWLARSKQAKSDLERRDSRLWTSMAMATLSAVLALLVVSGVRGYSPHDEPVKVSPPATPVVQAAATALRKPSPTTRSRSSRPGRTAVEKAALSTPEPKVATPKVTRKKIHHNEDEDYVAKDTYVYYGLNGKSSR